MGGPTYTQARHFLLCTLREYPNIYFTAEGNGNY
jgi:hypothetical protein